MTKTPQYLSLAPERTHLEQINTLLEYSENSSHQVVEQTNALYETLDKFDTEPQCFLMAEFKQLSPEFILSVKKDYPHLVFIGYKTKDDTVSADSKLLDYIFDIDQLPSPLAWNQSLPLLSENKKLTNKVSELQSRMDLSDLAETSIHEINNYLTLIQAQIVKMSKSLKDIKDDAVSVVKDHVERIMGTLSRAIGIASSAKSLDENAQLYKSSISIKLFLEGIKRQALALSENKGIKIELDTEINEDIHVEIDKLKLHQSLINIIKNSIEALESSVDKHIRIHTYLKSDFLHISIHDSGPGVPTEIRDHIFSKKFTTKRSSGGSGLGLYISKAFVEKHGGTIILRENQGRTFFDITLPIN